MNTITLGVRNAFRNVVRSISIMLILGLSIGLSLVMLIAHQAVGQKISDVKKSIGNTISIAPAGFSNFSQVNNALTTDDLAKAKALPHISSVQEMLTDRLTTIGATTPSFGGRGGSDNSNAQTSLSSPVTLDTNGAGMGGGRFFAFGGGSLPANFSLPIAIIGTTGPSSVNASSLHITSGQTIDGSKDANEALVSTDMANKNNLNVGSTFTAYNTTLTVAGIFDSGTRAGNDMVIVSLPTLQRLSGQSGDVTSAIATVDSIDNLSSATDAIKTQLGSSADVTNSADQVNQAIQPLNNVKNISLYSLIGAVTAGGVIILLTMVMIVRERRREIGILKAIGASNTRVVLQFMSEALTFTLLGAVVGLVIGVAGGNPVTNMLVSSSASSATTTAAAMPGGPGQFGGGMRGAGGGFVARRAFGAGNVRALGTNINTNIKNIHAEVGWSVLAYGLGAAILIAMVGSASAGWLIARVRPSEVMRAE